MSSVLSWDSSTLRAPTLPWTPLHHHRTIKQEPMDATMANPFVSNHSEGFHSASPSSSSRDSNPQSPCSVSPTPSRNQPTTFRPLTPPNYEISPENIRNSTSQPSSAAVTPPKSPSPSPPWTTTSEGALSPMDSAAENEDDPGVRIPTVNSHGKVKTFKCKQCEFIAVTKLDFWEHTKNHIKPERMLNCPKCPFVTEYKHHLEYHMRNHFGSKPFQCSQCPYSCVNKSMLNSHLKSHSNVYQYRCADCNYATKYCHSLKLHLRKYHHQPAMVLNQDGTPNPLPIIDVYGTRRGPKQRQSKHQQQQEESASSIQTNASVPSHSIFQNPFNVTFPYAPLLQHSMLFPHNNNNNNNNDPSLLSKVIQNQSPKKDEDNHVGAIQPISPHMLLQPRFLAEYNQSQFSPTSPYSNANNQTSETPMDQSADALDLTSKQEASPALFTPTMKSRRKGKAFKRSAQPVEDEDEGTSQMVMQNLKDNQVEEIEVSVDVPKFYDSDDKEDKEKLATSPEPAEPCHSTPPTKESYDCMYCDIVFKDIIMYTMHMGYHGFKDPFTCNMCGHRTSDKVSFFVHIARSQHS
ncbi:zinc finger protein hunchback [Arctopsyche grandis]|uniref:zinc finger protein hunchback n=1 Tax=Arctopsyche grandis TaxID=121162 RepID=UPI00406D8BEC